MTRIPDLPLDPPQVEPTQREAWLEGENNAFITSLEWEFTERFVREVCWLADDVGEAAQLRKELRTLITEFLERAEKANEPGFW